LITVPKSAVEEEQIMEAALEAGADDVTDEGECWQILTEPTDFADVRANLEQAGIAFEVAELSMIPSNTVECSGDDARKVMNLVDALEDNDDVQKVYANFDIPDDQLAALES
jgi:transcriptional/translational regulatory protein YebC/TACO1